MSLERLRSGLSHEARQTLAGTLGSKAAELLGAAGIDMQDYKSPEALIEETRAKLEAFAQQLHPDYQTDPSDYDKWLQQWDVAWDEEADTPAIWHKDPKTGEYDTDCLLNISKREPTGKLLLPSEMRITDLFCGNNQLTKLPNLPDGLAGLYCDDNKLTSLPDLPTSLTRLYCYNNKLASLPDLPDGLTELLCNGNQLTKLPSLPDGLAGLYCSNNRFPEGYIEQLKKRYPNVVIM